MAGVPAQNTKGGHNKALDTDMEDGIKEYLNFLIHYGHQGTHKDIRLAANLILRVDKQ
jgi:hypothetical protein